MQKETYKIEIINKDTKEVVGDPIIIEGYDAWISVCYRKDHLREVYSEEKYNIVSKQI